VALGSAESTTAVHGRLGSPDRAACVFVHRFIEGNPDRADADTIQGTIAACPTKPFCDRVVGQPGMPAYAAHLHRGVAVHWFRPGRLDIEFGRHEICDLTSAAPPTSLSISWRGTSERCAKGPGYLLYAASRFLTRWRQ